MTIHAGEKQHVKLQYIKDMVNYVMFNILISNTSYHSFPVIFRDLCGMYSMYFDEVNMKMSLVEYVKMFHLIHV